jgi:hypothetical protein
LIRSRSAINSCVLFRNDYHVCHSRSLHNVQDNDATRNDYVSPSFRGLLYATSGESPNEFS